MVNDGSADIMSETNEDDKVHLILRPFYSRSLPTLPRRLPKEQENTSRHFPNGTHNFKIPNFQNGGQGGCDFELLNTIVNASCE